MISLWCPKIDKYGRYLPSSKKVDSWWYIYIEKHNRPFLPVIVDSVALFYAVLTTLTLAQMVPQIFFLFAVGFDILQFAEQTIFVIRMRLNVGFSNV